MKIFLYILAFFLSALPYYGYSQDYHIQNFNNENHLPQPYVYALAQDDYGYLWIGTGNGLVKYNGYTFETYSTADSLADNFVTCSFKTEDGIWFGHRNGDLSFYSKNSFSAVINTVKEKTMVTDIEKYANNKLWASMYYNGFLILDKEHKIKSVPINKKDESSILCFKFVGKNEILVGSDIGLSLYSIDENDSLIYKETIQRFNQIKIVDILKLPNENIFIVATQNNGIYKLTKGNYGYTSVKIGMALKKNISGVQSLLFDRNKDIWATSFGEGLYKFKSDSSGKYKNAIQFTKKQGLTSEYIKVVFEDREGSIWCGNYGTGLSHIYKRKYSYSHYDKDLYGENILSVSLGNNYKWLGTEKGLMKVEHQTGQVEEFYSHKHGLPKDKITAIYKTDTLIWIGTKNNGIYGFDPINETAQPYHIGTGRLENSITSIIGKNGQLWVGTVKGVCNITVKSDSIQWYTIKQGGLRANTINHLYLDSKNRLWIATASNNLAVIEDSVIKNIALSKNNNSFVVSSVIEDIEKNIWVGTLGNGIYKLENGGLYHFSSSDGLFSDYCYSIIIDEHENLWCSHKGGISQVNIKNSKIKTFQQDFDIKKSYQFNINAVAIDEYNTIWLGMNKGLLAINVYENIITEPPLIRITSIRVKDKEIEIKPNIRLKPGRYKISIEYIGVNLKDPTQTKYSYKLDGFDDNIVQTYGTKVVYPKLSDGSFSFHVTATNGDGITSEPVKLNIYIGNPIWQSPWFYVLLLLIIVFVNYLAYRKHKKNIQEKEKVLESMVVDRTIEILEQKERIKKQSDLISIKNKNITDSITYASFIQNAILPPQDLVNSILPNSFIINHPKDIVSGDFYYVIEKNNYLIFAVADCSGHGVPGAFLSMLGISLLNNIIHEKGVITPNEILAHLREGIIKSLRQDKKSGSSLDSICMAICALDKKTLKLQYSGATHPLTYIQNGEINVIKADRMVLGISENNHNDFTLHEISVRNGDSLYMYSDGFQDQFGGPRLKKFLSRRLNEILKEHSDLPPCEQKDAVEKVFLEWKGNNEQTDDVLLMGVQL